MDHLTYARAQMGLSLAFHMAFAAAGVALPLFLVLADVLHARTKDPDYLEFARRMAKGTSILFAVGAVSGTALSFELGLLWPSFMGTFGDVIGMPFALEGFAFFTEAVFLGIYLYGRDRIPPKLHLAAGVIVAVSGLLSAFFVTLVNACMNLPAGFTMANGRPVDIDPWRAMFSPTWRQQTLHALLACYEATAFALAGIHAAVLLKHPTSTLFRKAFDVTLAVACVTAILQPLSGHGSAQGIAVLEPAKLAACEGLFVTQRRAPIVIGGVADVERRTVRGGIEIPAMLSVLAFDTPDGEVTGLDRVPRDEWPPVAGTHLAFDTMVGSGSALAALAGVAALLSWRRRHLLHHKWFLRAVVAAGPLGLVALEAGWLVTELGRQPWIVHGAMRTRDAVTPFPHLQAPFWIFTLLYLFLGVTVVYLLGHQLRHASVTAREAAPESEHAL